MVCTNNEKATRLVATYSQCPHQNDWQTAVTEILSGLWANEVQTVSTLTLHSVSSEPSFLVCV